MTTIKGISQHIYFRPCSIYRSPINQLGHSIRYSTRYKRDLKSYDHEAGTEDAEIDK